MTKEEQERWKGANPMEMLLLMVNELRSQKDKNKDKKENK